MSGQGKAIVCCVGENTLLARNRKKNDLVMDEQQTFLELKLEKTAQLIQNYSVVACILSILTHTLFLICLIMFSSDHHLFTNDTLLKMGKIAIIAVVILIVSIPEGLPLAVSIAMALSINQLKKDQILIKNLEAVQTCAMLHDICVGKTGTLTTGKMHVSSYQIGSDPSIIENNPELNPTQFIEEQSISFEVKELIKDAIISNTDVRIECNEKEFMYEPKGQSLEVGLIQFLLDNQEDIQSTFIRRNKLQPKIVQIPFDQELKRKVVVRQVKTDPTKVRIYVKGAPEYILPKCNSAINSEGSPTALDDSLKMKLLDETIS